MSLVGFAVLQLGTAGCDWGCEATESCPEARYIAPTAGAGGGGAGSSSGSMTTTSTMTSSSTGVSMDCAVTLESGPTLGDSCGVFVDPAAGDDGAMGTMSAPLKTLAAAAAAWVAGKAVYVCDGTLTDASAVTLPAGLVLYGGLDCAAGYKIKSAAARTTLEPGAGVIPLTLAAGAAATEVHQFAIKASAAAAPGSSAVGVVIDAVPATLRAVDVVAGSGANGASSVTPTDPIGPGDANDPAIKGTDGAPANTTSVGTKNPGAPAKLNGLCSTNGGAGGDGGEIVGVVPQNGVMGTAGAAIPPPTTGANDGHGGIGDSGTGCTSGGDGKPGDAASDGDGAGPTALGALSVDGYSGVAGQAGTDGNPGQGGGGGGGARGKHLPAPDTRGASGGSGGAGGCGGKGAAGGGPGGSSLALVLLGAEAPSLIDVTLVAGSGGSGGSGAPGQFGATGGNGGSGGNGATLGLNNGCAGGIGGKGSNGGSGGGGRGGHSVGIAYVTAAPTSGFSVSHGGGGLGGPTAGAGGAADPGVADDVLQLPAQ